MTRRARSSLISLLPLSAIAAAATFYACSSSDSSSRPSTNDADVEDTGTASVPVGTGDAQPVVTVDASGDDDTSPPDGAPPPVVDAGHPPPVVDAGHDAAAPVDAAPPVDAGTDSAADAAVDAGADAAPAPTCVGVTGATVNADWTFAASKSSLNGNNGQLLTVNRCDTVIWTNKDNGVPHSVVGTGGFTFATDQKSGTTAGVALKPIQFTTAGTFTYDCGVHGTMMIGKITVN